MYYRFSVFARVGLFTGRRASATARSCPLRVRNAATFILPVPYVSDFSITAARYFTGNLRVANGVHNEAEMAWRTDGPGICLPSVPSSCSLFRSPNTRLLPPRGDLGT